VENNIQEDPIQEDTFQDFNDDDDDDDDDEDPNQSVFINVNERSIVESSEAW